MGALAALVGALAFLVGAWPAAGRIGGDQDPQGAPVVELLDALSAYIAEPWAPASAAPAPSVGVGALNTTALQDYVGAAAPPPKVVRGIGLFGPNIPGELQVFAKNGLTWYYTWDLYSDPSSLNIARLYGTEFVPMVWGAKQLVGAAPRLKKPNKGASYYPKNTEYLLGFNEPNIASQSNLTALQAAQLWPQVTKLAKNLGLKIGSPAPAHCGQPNCLTPTPQAPFDWLNQFFGNCTKLYGRAGCQVDIMAVHYYGCTVADFQRFMVQMAQVYNRPIWVTEFACGLQPNIASLTTIMKQFLTMLDRQPMVARYSWFAAHTQGVDFLGPLCSLMQNSYSVAALTPLGQTYCTYVAGGKALPVPYDLSDAFHAHVRSEICSSCGAAVAGASLLWPDPDLQGLCSMHCGFRF